MVNHIRQAVLPQVAAALRDILESGDQPYLRSLAPAALLEACEQELYFLGLLRHGEDGADAALRAEIAHQLTTWLRQEQEHRRMHPARYGKQEEHDGPTP